MSWKMPDEFEGSNKDSNKVEDEKAFKLVIDDWTRERARQIEDAIMEMRGVSGPAMGAMWNQILDRLRVQDWALDRMEKKLDEAMRLIGELIGHLTGKET